jgi:hypothetical protein
MGARLDERPPFWVHISSPPRAVRLGRTDATRIDPNPNPSPLYATNPGQSNVCVVVAREEPPAALTVITKRAARADQRYKRAAERTRRNGLRVRSRRISARD